MLDSEAWSTFVSSSGAEVVAPADLAIADVCGQRVVVKLGGRPIVT